MEALLTNKFVKRWYGHKCPYSPLKLRKTLFFESLNPISKFPSWGVQRTDGYSWATKSFAFREFKSNGHL